MSYEMDSYDLQSNNSKGLFLTQSGFQKSHSGHHAKEMVYSDYSVHFILAGKGKYTTGGKEYELNKGQGFVIFPGEANEYTADRTEPWQYIYVSFNGIDSDRLLFNCGITKDKPIFEFPADNEMLDHLNSMFLSGKNKLTKGYDALGYFLIAMSRIIKEHSKDQINDKENYYIDMALEYMENYYSNKITVKDIAKYIGFDRTYFYRMFVKKMNMSPTAYINEIRLKKAISLMEARGVSLSEIAVITGFYDYSHFTKAFMRKYHISPGEYKKNLAKKGDLV